MEIILSREIKLEDLDFAQKIIEAFVEDYSKLYTISSMLSGVHQLLHLVECTKNFGPLNNINCFPFEELNRKVIGTIHGRALIGEEFIKLFSLMQSQSYTVTSFAKQSKLVNFIKKEMVFKTSNRKKTNYGKIEIKVLGRKEIIKDSQVLTVIDKTLGIKLEEIETFSKIVINGVIFTTSKLETKNSDSCFRSKKGKIGYIEFFFFNK